MRLKLRAIGNSVGIIFPVTWLKKYNLHIGDNIDGKDNDSSIILTTIKPKKKYLLKDLVAQCSSLDLTVEDNRWLSMDDIGEEKVW